MSGLRLALVHRKLSRHGGVEKNVLLLATGLARRGHRVTVFCRKADERPPGVEVVEVPARGATLIGKYESFAENASRAVGTGSWDVVQGFDLTVGQDVMRLGRGVIKVYREVMSRTRSGLDKWWRSRDTGRWVALEERMLETSGLVVTNSRTVRTELMEAYGMSQERIRTIHNGVDLERLSVEKARAGRDEVRREYGIPEGAGLVSFVGTGFRRKGLDTLLRAMADLDAHLLVVGRDGATRRYRRLAAQLGLSHRVRFAGAVAVTPALFGAADVLALPSRYEPFSNVVLEALACGVPAVHPATGGAAEALERGLQAQILPDAEDPVALAGILEATLADPPSAQTCRAAAEAFPESACIDHYETLYKRLVEARS